MLRYLPVLLFAVYYATLAEEVPCMRTKENCTQNISYSALTIINSSNYYCCVVGCTMTWDTDQCLCNKTSEVTQCDEGPELCANASSIDAEVHSADRDTIQCCQEGYTKQIFAGYVDGSHVTTCLCSRGLTGGVVLASLVAGDEHSVNYTNYLGDPSFLDTGLLQRLLDWAYKALDSLNQELNSALEEVFWEF